MAMVNMDAGGDMEAEAVLFVASADPAAVATAVLAIDPPAGGSLGPVRSIQTVDSHFDTPDRALAERDLSLRLRRLPDRTVLGLKGEEVWTEKGVLRLEVEERWSPNGLATILHELGFRDVALTWPGIPITGSDPDAVLRSIGLEVVQTRALARSARTVLDAEGKAVAELSLDVVTQRVEGRRVVYREVEIEAANPSEYSAVSELADALLALLPGDLRRWRHSKLATGIAIARLFGSEGDPSGLLTGDGELTPAAVDALASELGRG